MCRPKEHSLIDRVPLSKRTDCALTGVLLLFATSPVLSDDKVILTASAPAGNIADRRIVISIPDKKLALVKNGRALKVYSVAVGALSTPTPTGQLRIINKLVAPTYYHSGRIVRPGKSNPVGSRWLGLSKKGYGIHGTNVPSSIGRAASHGCIRMRTRDVEELFELVRVDDVVEIHDERDASWAQILGDARATSLAAPNPPVHADPQASPVGVSASSGQL